MAAFSEDFIEKVRDASDLVDIIGQDTQLKGSGGSGTQLMGICPFPDHAEKTPSFSVNGSKQVYHCFGCQKGGNIFHYLRDMKGMSFPEAVEHLAHRAGIPIPKDQKPNNESDQQKQKRDQLHRINHIAARFFHETLKNLPESHQVKQYLKGRGISDAMVEEFLIGYAPEGWESLKNYLVEKKVPLALAEEVGLVKARKGGEGYFDIFRHRLMFPIISHRDHYVGFGGRVINKEDQPKYLNSPDSDVFHKGSLFYGLKDSAKYIRAEDHVVVVEGYTDYLALYQAGIRCVVATLGTALTDRHAKLIKRHTKNVFVLFDGDEAGQNAATRSLNILLQEGVFPKGLTLRDNKDPDDFIKSFGAAELRRELAKAPDLFDLVLSRWMMGYQGSPSEKIQLMDKIAPVILSVPDRRLLQLYAQTVAQRLNVTPDWVTQALRQEKAGAEGRAAAAPARADNFEKSQILQDVKDKDLTWIETTIHLKGASRAEIELINVALLNERYLQWVLEEKAFQDIPHPGARRVLEIIADRYGQMPNKFDSLTAYLQTLVEPHEHVARHLKKPLSDLDPEGAKKFIQDCLRRLKADRLRQKQRELAQKLQYTQGFGSPEELEQIMNIHRDRHSLKKNEKPS